LLKERQPRGCRNGKRSHSSHPSDGGISLGRPSFVDSKTVWGITDKRKLDLNPVRRGVSAFVLWTEGGNVVEDETNVDGF